MQCYLPYPYPDELLSGSITRYLKHAGLTRFERAMVCALGRAARPSVYLPSSLNAISERTALTWGKTGVEIAIEHTLFPYYSRYLRAGRAEQCLKKLLSLNFHATGLLLGVPVYRVKVNRFLRFCHACRELDILKYGETYWHRCHQLPGVLVCPDHNEHLINSPALMHPKNFGDYLDATVATDSPQPMICEELSKRDHENAHTISKLSCKILQGITVDWSSDNIGESYRNTAMDRGFIEGGCNLSVNKLEKAFSAFYGERFLEILGCDFHLDRNGSWFRNIFRSNTKSFHPLEHILVQLFLKHTPTDSSNIPSFGFGPWKCPNPYCKHKGKLPIKEPKIYVGYKHRKHVASAKCDCGYHFTFQSVSKSDLQMPVVSKVMQYGPTWEDKARQLHKSGRSMLAIAREMGVYDSTIKKILESKKHQYDVRQDDILKWRREWLKTLAKTPNRSRSEARKRNYGLYLRLWRNDRTWLLAEPRKWNHKPSNKQRVAWITRDKDWSGRLELAAANIKNAHPIKQATRTAIIHKADLPKKILAHLNVLPLCRSVLRDSSESLDDCRERRLRAAAAKANEMGIRLTEYKLRVLAGLRKASLSPRLQSVFQHLLSELPNLMKV